MKPLRFSKHAEIAIQQRQLDPQWVERTVREPDWIESDPVQADTGRCFRAIAERDGRYLRVVVVQTPAEFRIVTAFFDRDASPK